MIGILIVGVAVIAQEPEQKVQKRPPLVWEEKAFKEWATANREAFEFSAKVQKKQRNYRYRKILDDRSNKILKKYKIIPVQLMNIAMRGTREGWETEKPEDLTFAEKTIRLFIDDLKMTLAEQKASGQAIARRSQARELAEDSSRFETRTVRCGYPEKFGLCASPVSPGHFCEKHK